MGLRDKFDNLRKDRKSPPPTPGATGQSFLRTPPSQSGNAPATPRNTGTSFPKVQQDDQSLITSQSMSLSELALSRVSEVEAQRAAEEAARAAAETVEQPILAPSGLEGTVINGNYQIEKLLAQGGMGQVFLATHLNRNNLPVVLKLLLKNDTQSSGYKRFIQEMLLAGRLTHPNLVKVYDYGILLEGFRPYLVMEFVDGEPLRKTLRRERQMKPADIARILMQVCNGLHEVHTNDIVHRDLKPENLMVRGDLLQPDNVRILDFGIACLRSDNKFDERGVAVGSIGYMSPEQICAAPVDFRTDIYSLGVIFYEAITGRPPFIGSTRAQAMELHVKAPHMPPSTLVRLDADAAIVDRIADRCLAKRPEQRYQSVLQLQQELEALLFS